MQSKQEHFEALLTFLESLHEEVFVNVSRETIIECLYQVADKEVL